MLTGTGPQVVTAIPITTWGQVGPVVLGLAIGPDPDISVAIGQGSESKVGCDRRG